MVRKNFVGAPLLKEKFIRDGIFAFGIIPVSILIGTQLNTFAPIDFLLIASLFCLIVSWIIWGNLYNRRAYKLKEEWK